MSVSAEKPKKENTTTMTSKDRIVEILNLRGEISNFFCIDNRITTRLSDVIFRLKKVGWEFRSEMNEKNCTYYVLKNPTKVEVKELQTSLFN